MRPGLDMHRNRIRPGFREAGKIGIARGDHEMHVKGIFANGRRARTIAGPIVMFGTKWPSMTSM